MIIDGQNIDLGKVCITVFRSAVGSAVNSLVTVEIAHTSGIVVTATDTSEIAARSRALYKLANRLSKELEDD